jgi:hypothetical protein
MAEFKLGRIRFVWQGDWAANVGYVADDVVSFGGKSYICIQNHTSNTEFNTDFESDIPKWDIVSDGTSWKADWAPEVEYAPGDVVKYGANVYICENGHTSATFVAPDYLGLEANLDDWTSFATSFDWKASWTNTTRYKINDLVRYGSYVYVCNTAHVSATTDTLGLESDQAKWTLFSEGLVYTGEWVTATRYRVNDLVKYGGNVWIATAAHSSVDFEADESYWESFVEGFQFENSWTNLSNYQIGDTVTYGGYIYVAKTNNTNSQPTANPDDWDVFTTGFKFQGDWAVLTNYKVGDVVRLGGNTYVAQTDNVGTEPPAAAWEVLNTGINWTISTETFLQAQGTNLIGSGSGARFDIVKSKTVYTVTVSTGFAGTGYAVNDVIQITGDVIGGTSPANDLTVTVSAINAGEVTGVTHTGVSSTWKLGQAYAVGDVVVYGASSFIAITKHTATVDDRPDNDLTAAYWNLLTLGSEAFALTTDGDMVYYGENGPTRLPVGIDGQILRATDGVPAWANYGLIDNVVYIGPLGTNEPAPASGLTIDKPWRSVRYALEQVRDGYLNPEAKHILKNNKEFFMKEITNWVKYTYRVNITEATTGTQTFTCSDTSKLDRGMPIVFDGTLGGVTAGTIYFVDQIITSTTFRISDIQNSNIPRILTTGVGQMVGDLAYDSVKCERDTGYIVDAVIYDVSRGGTSKTVEAAKAYYTVAGNLYINGTFGSQDVQTVEAYTQLKSIIGTVLNNKQPVSFQHLNNIPRDERAVQIIDLSLTAEETAKTKAAGLVDIITTGIAAGSATAVPTATNPNTTVFIKTGTYNEVLPIVVPEFTAIVGDELRTSVVQPAPATPLLATDSNKATSALKRIKEVIPDVLQNIDITKTTGNTTVQEYVNGYAGNTAASNRLAVGTGLITEILQEGLDVIPALPAVGSTPTSGANNASDAGHADAIAQIEANIDFIVAEQTAWIQFQVANVIAPFAADFTFDTANCERDTKYIIDALRYDLTYGGNLETTVAARSYFVNGNPVYGTGKKDETLATYAHLKLIIGDVITETAITPTSGNTLTQDVTGTPGSAAAETFTDTRIQEIYDCIDNDGTLPTPVAPDLTWVPATLTTVNTNVVAQTATIQNAVIDHVNTNYGDYTYDSAKCRRDSGLLQTNSAYDVALNTNYNAVRDGLSYRRQMSKEVIDNQLTETVGAITQEKTLVAALMSDATAITRNAAYWDEVIDIVSNGTANADTITFSDPGGVAAKTTARTQLQSNRQDIIDDLTVWIAANYPNLDYTVETCERDTGRIIDAVSYDIQYGGNSAIIEAANAYFIGYAQALPLPQRAASAAAMAQLAIIATDYMSGATEEAEVAALLQIVVDVITSGDKIDLPTKVYPSTTWVAAGIKADADAVLADTSVVPAVLQYITNTYSNFVYDHAKCSRDVGFMLDALRFDIMFDSTFRSIKAGMSYQRGIASAQVVLANQLEATVDTIDVVRAKVREITTGTKSVNNSNTIIKDIIINNNVAATTISDPTGYDTGFFNARRLIVANKQFLIDEAEAYLADQYNAVWTALTVDEQTAWLADVGYSINSLEYDLTYRGNLETIVTARAYYVDGVFVRLAGQKAATLALQSRLADIIDDVATGNTITRTTGNTTVQDVTGTAGTAGAAAFAQDRMNEIANTIDTGDSPAAINPSVLWVDPALAKLKTVADSRREIIQDAAIAYINYSYPALVYNEAKCKRDVGYMVDAIVYDAIFGSNYRSITAGMSYRRDIASAQVVLNNQLEPSIDTVDFVNTQLLEITQGIESDLGTREYADKAAELADIIKDVFANGIGAVPGVIMPSITGHNTATLTDLAFATTTNPSGNSNTYGNAADQLQLNKEFIKDEVRHWLEDPVNGFDTYWGGFNADTQTRCIRDVGYIVDAVRYDLMYGGNTQSLVAGSAYYSNFILTIAVDELPATLAAYARMRTVIGEVIAETTVTTSPGVTELQDITGTPGNSESVEFAQDRVDDVLDWINNAEANATIEIANKWALPDLTHAYNRLVDRRYEIQEDVVFWVEKFWQKIEYNQDTCRRDAGLMVDAITRDLLTGSNFASIIAGRSYYRGLSSTKEVRDNEKLATIGAVNFLKQKVRHVAATTAAAHADIIIDDITNYINGGKLPALQVLPLLDLAIYETTTQAAATTIWENKEFIKVEILAYLDENYPNISYSRDKCVRDVGLAVDALRYDLTYGGNSASQQVGISYYLGTGAEDIVIDPDDKAATVAAFEHMQFIVDELAQNRLDSPGALQFKIAPKFRDANTQVVGTPADGDTAFALAGDIVNLIESGPGARGTADVESIASNVITTVDPHGLKAGDEISVSTDFGGMISETIYYIRTAPTTTTLTLSETFGGIEYVLEDEAPGGLGGAIGSLIIERKVADLTDVSASLQQQYTNLQGSKSAIQQTIIEYLAENYPTLVYNEVKCRRDVGLIVDAVGYDMMLNSNYKTTVAALSYARGAQAEIVLEKQKTATVQSYRELKNQIATFVTNDKVAVKRCNELMDIIIQMLDKGVGETPEMTGTITYYNDVQTIKGVDILKANSKFLAQEAIAHVEQSFGGTATGIADSPGTITFSAAHNFIKGDPIYFDENAFGGLVADTTYYVSSVPSLTTITVAATVGQVGNDPIVLDGGVGTSVARYKFNETAFRIDMERYIEAIAYDLQYPGNYKSLRQAELYLNAVNGSERSDMFYVRNSTGVRNQTLNGLRGNLTELNEFGTRRPTAGAYVSLDPGFGPWDKEAWIGNKSPYVQNVTTFGVGCVGNKIDGALHAGGNRSTVSNDFTQVLSDGIGVWCTGNNSLTELVSVFAYYNYSGYIADLGGRIRATNGNSSYGTYGVIAEGTDTGEVPILAEVNNKSADAFASEVPTDGSAIMRLEFDNAGRNYTNAQFALSGSGFNATCIMDEYRDGGVFETRLIDLNDNNGVGGSDYVTAKNVAQGGSPIHVTIAATDTALGGGYNGMRIQITAGTGVGQYGNILGFNNGTKVATVYKDNVGPFTVTDTNATGNVVTLTGPTEQIYVGMPVYVASSVGGLLIGNTPSNVYYVITDNRDGTVVLSEEEGGTAVTLTTTTGQTVAMYEAGWEHSIPGNPIAASLDLTTGYTIEPRITYQSPGFSSTATTVTSNAYEVATYANGNFYGLPYGADQVIQSADGETWTDIGILPSAANWSDVTFGGGTGVEAEVIIGGLGGSGAVLTCELGELNSIGLPGPTQIAKVTVVDGGKGYTTAPTITFIPTSGGGGASAVCTVLNGSIQDVIITSTGAGYGAVPNVQADTDKVTEVKVIQTGRGYKTPPTITLTGGGATTQATLVPTMDNEGVAFITIGLDIDNNILNGAGYTTQPTITIEDTNAKFVAVATGSVTNASITLADIEAGNNWTAGSVLPNANFVSVIYGNGTYVAVGGAGGVGSGASSTDGSTWTGRSMPALGAGTYSSVAYGQGKFIAVNTGGVGTTVSTNGIVWTAGGNLPTSAAWVDVVYGNGRFVTIANGARDVAYSVDEGVTWYAAPGGLPSGADWKTIKYAQGLFVCVAETSDKVATSWDGIVWTEETLSASGAWHGLAHGRATGQQPRWVALTNAADTVATLIATGSTARARLSEADGAIVTTRMIEPGSAYPNGNATSTTAANTITIDSTARLQIGQPITFYGLSTATLNDDQVYYVNTIPSTTEITVSLIANTGIPVTVATSAPTGATWKAGPLHVIVDPNSTEVAPIHARQGNGVLGNPTFTNRGTGYQTATSEGAGDGFADLFQPATFVAVRGLFDLPEPGSNVEFTGIDGTWFKLVAVNAVIGEAGDYSATLQISPGLTVLQAPLDGVKITATNKYSQVRLTGHDFLYIGTGNQAKTNYPYVDITTSSVARQQLSSGGGRVFFTSTDQDGNFNVGGLFGVQQSTGTATLDADAFNLAGLQSLQLQGIGLGIGSAIITQFSTDPFFTANSDSIVPTQRAIKSYITAQIGGGQSSLNVNTLTAGVVFIANDEITTTSGGQLNIKAKMNFTGGIDGAPVALGFFLAR